MANFLATNHQGPGAVRQVLSVDAALTTAQIGLNVPGALDTPDISSFAPGRAVNVPGYGTYALFHDGLFRNQDTAPGQGGAWTQVVVFPNPASLLLQSTPGPKLVYRNGQPFLVFNIQDSGGVVILFDYDVVNDTSTAGFYGQPFRPVVCDGNTGRSATPIQVGGQVIVSGGRGTGLQTTYAYEAGIAWSGAPWQGRILSAAVGAGAVVDNQNTNTHFLCAGPNNRIYTFGAVPLTGSPPSAPTPILTLFGYAGSSYSPLAQLPGIPLAAWGNAEGHGFAFYLVNPVTALPNLIAVVPDDNAGGFHLVQAVLDSSGDVSSLSDQTTNLPGSLQAGGGFGSSAAKATIIAELDPATGDPTFRCFFAPDTNAASVWQERPLTFTVGGAPQVGLLAASGLAASLSLPYAPTDPGLYAAPAGANVIRIDQYPTAPAPGGGAQVLFTAFGGGTGLTVRALAAVRPSQINDPNLARREPFSLSAVGGGSATLNVNGVQMDDVDADGTTQYSLTLDQAAIAEYQRLKVSLSIA